MMFWPGYERYVREGDTRRIWVRRAKCDPCRASHALLPSFVLPRRFYAVEVIGAALARMAAGATAGAAAGVLGLPYATVRDWRYRYRARASALAAGFAAVGRVPSSGVGVGRAFPSSLIGEGSASHG